MVIASRLFSMFFCFALNAVFTASKRRLRVDGEYRIFEPNVAHVVTSKVFERLPALTFKISFYSSVRKPRRQQPSVFRVRAFINTRADVRHDCNTQECPKRRTHAAHIERAIKDETVARPATDKKRFSATVNDFFRYRLVSLSRYVNRGLCRINSLSGR